jgi:hypothetical protein
MAKNVDLMKQKKREKKGTKKRGQATFLEEEDHLYERDKKWG